MNVRTNAARSRVKPLLRKPFSKPRWSSILASQSSLQRSGRPGPDRVPVAPRKADGSWLTVHLKARMVCSHRSHWTSNNNAAGIAGCLFRCSTHRTKDKDHSCAMLKFHCSRAPATTRFRRRQNLSALSSACGGTVRIRCSILLCFPSM